MSGLIVISDIMPDTESNQYVRLVQVYSDLPVEGSQIRPIVEISLYGGDQTSGDVSPLQIAVPGGILF
jgi:hypothetical protein